MPPRVTRASARLTAGSSNPTDEQSSPPHPPLPSRKRKAAKQEPSPEPPVVAPEIPSRKRAKRIKAEPAEAPPPPPEPRKTRKSSRATAAMSTPGNQPDPFEEQPSNVASTSSIKRKSNRKKGANETVVASSSTAPPSRHPKKPSKSDRSASKARTEKRITQSDKVEENNTLGSMSDESSADGLRGAYDDMDDDEQFGRGWPGPQRYANAMRHLSSMMAGVVSELRSILERLRQKDDPDAQRLALEELAQTLLMANEDTLAGHFSPDIYIKELVTLMQPNDFGEENPEMMLLACRCIANMMEALPACTANVVYGGAVPILCQKLLEIHYIDLAEQALSTLEKISVEFPAAIVREGGLTACLTYLDFFATSTQRTAVTTAANCCRNIPEELFPVVRDVMPILLQVLNSSDQKVLEQGCLCVSRIAESFKFQEIKLEELISEDLLRTILRLLLPGTTNLIGANIHTLFLRVLAFTARCSPKRSVELIRMNVVDTLFQILTGVSPPTGTGDIVTKIDKVMIMQSLIHRPRDQIFETLNVICELLPNITQGAHYLTGLFDTDFSNSELAAMLSMSRNSGNDNRSKLLEGCKVELRRFIVILLPTLTDAYSSTVNLGVRQTVLTAQLKMLSNVDVDILEEALRSVSYSSFLAAILSQGDHVTLVTSALQAAEILLQRLENVYRYQFYREGVIAEIAKLAARPVKTIEEKAKGPQLPLEPADSTQDTNSTAADTIGELEMEFHDGHDDELSEDDHDENDENDENDDADENQDEITNSESDSDDDPRHVLPSHASLPNPEDLITSRAKKFIELHDNDGGEILRTKAATSLDDLKKLTQEIKDCFLEKGRDDGYILFKRLSNYLGQDALANVTSYELLSSKIVEVLLEVFSGTTPRAADARKSFLQAFMGQGTQTKETTASSASPATPFSVLVHKLQDLLSRAEHFEVITVHHNSYDSGRASATNMLAKQLRIKLVADEDSGIPRSYRQMMVSIHAIATFKSLGDFLRPRLSLSERTKGSSRRDGMPEAIAAYAAALAGRRDPGSPFPPPMPTPSDLTNRSVSKRGPPPKPAAAGSPTPNRSQASSSTASALATNVRRSRRHQTQPPPPPPPPMNNGEVEEETIECADERQISDDEDMDDDSALNALVDHLEDDMEVDEEDPSAVNMEVAPTGKVTARKEDGTRVATPVGSQPAPRTLSGPRLPASLAQRLHTSSTRALSYAAAMAATPQDWHIEFSVNGQPISPDTTIYRVVHFNQAQPNEVSARSLWTTIHSVKFKRVSGPPPAESSTLAPPPETSLAADAGLPASLSHNPTTAAILRLLSLLHGLNSNIDDVLADNKDSEKLVAEPLSQFVNTKLTAKLNRQLEEPLIVASNCLPSWSEDLARLYPFLFPFETRHLFLQSTSFGYSRSMSRWQNAQTSNDSRNDRHRDERPFLGKLQRQKVRISRAKILESAVKVMELYGSSPAVLEVEYFEEVGTGLGPTLEFYSTVSREFAKKKLKLWRENDLEDNSEYVFGARGLFPAPMSQQSVISENGKRVLNLYKSLGKFVARSMLDSRIIDISFNPTFFRVGDSASPVTPSLGAVESVDEALARSLRQLKKAAIAKQKIDEDELLSPEQKADAAQNIRIGDYSVENLALDFTLPGYPSIELIPNGSHIDVTIDNVGDYINKVMEFTLGTGVRSQVEAFAAGFSMVFPYAALQAFTPDELVMLFGRVDEDWSLETLMDSIKADHGFNLDSKSVRNLLQIMSTLSLQEKREFLQFVTGSPKLPIGGFKSLTPMFTVVCKPSEGLYTSDDYLPSVMTCVNYLKLPDYSTVEIMRNKLSTAMKEGQGAFHLS